MAGAIPFSALMLPELLLGELGAEPGALLQAESAGGETGAISRSCWSVSYTHLTLPTTGSLCRSRWSPYH